jgi:hypothetical protein
LPYGGVQRAGTSVCAALSRARFECMMIRAEFTPPAWQKMRQFVVWSLCLWCGVDLATAQQQCANSACIVTASCSTPDNSSEWKLANKTIDSVTASNLQLLHINGLSIVNCPGTGNACHAWGPGFGDRNGVMLLDGE